MIQEEQEKIIEEMSARILELETENDRYRQANGVLLAQLQASAEILTVIRFAMKGVAPKNG